MFRRFWNRIRDIFAVDTTETLRVTKELIIAEYNSVLYELYRADSLETLLKVRRRIRKLHTLMVDSEMEFWGRRYIVHLTKLWNAKFQYWKDKARNR